MAVDLLRWGIGRFKPAGFSVGKRKACRRRHVRVGACLAHRRSALFPQSSPRALCLSLRCCAVIFLFGSTLLIFVSSSSSSSSSLKLLCVFFFSGVVGFVFCFCFLLGYLEALVLFHLRFNMFSITFIATHSSF